MFDEGCSPPLGGAGGEAHGMTELAVAHKLAGERCATAQLATQLAHDPGLALVIDVDVLTHERSSIAVDASVALGRQRSDAASQEEALELLDISMRRGHGGYFRRARLTSFPVEHPNFRHESFGRRSGGVGWIMRPGAPIRPRSS